MLRSIYSRFMAWLLKTHAMRFTLRYVVPEIKILHAPGPGYNTKEHIRKNMRPGDVLVSKSTYRLTNLVIGGKFSHGAFVINTNEIAEMTAKDFDVVDVNEFAAGCTHIALLRLKSPDQIYANKMVEKCLSFSDARYDADFSLGVEALYCSELVYQSDFERRMKCNLDDIVGMGRPYISPDGLFCAPGLELVYEWVDTGW